MNRFRLFFQNSALEKKYQNFNRPFVHKQFDDYFKILIVLMLVMNISGVIKYDMTLRRLMVLIGLVIFLGFMFLIKKLLNKLIFQTIIIVFCSLIGFLFIELVHMNFSNGAIEKAACFQLLAFQFFLDLILLTRIGWMYCSVLYLANALYYFLRFSLWDSVLKEEALMGVCILAIIYAIMAYRHEKTSREAFKDIQESSDNLRKFKEIMQRILPSPIIVANYSEEKVEFMNNSAEKLIRKKRDVYFDSPFHGQHLLKSDAKLFCLSFLEETLDCFNLVNQDNLITSNGDTQLVSSIFRRFSKEFQGQENDQTLNNFLTLHIKDSGENDSSLIEKSQIQTSKKHYYEIKACKIDWENKDCILLIFNDQTKSKMLLELMNLDSYKDEILATVSHDLRTPLNGVTGMMWSVLPFLKDKEAKKNLLIGIRSANILNLLINDILDFSQMKFKKLRLNLKSLNLLDLINEIIILVKSQAKKKKQILKKDFLLGENQMIFSDPTRIKQILLNLLGNAIKFTNKEGSVILRVEDCEESKVKFSVSDTGIGIKREDMKELFSIFGKLKQENPEINKTGIGLGLMISNNLAKLLNPCNDGGIKVESEYGKGTTFSFVIEKSKREESFDDQKLMNESIKVNFQKYSTQSIDKSVMTSNPSSTCYLMHPQRILIVDDDPINVMILEQYLKYFKFDYLTAMNGLEAVLCIETEVINEKKDISAILMDCNMPVMDGFKASQKINELLRQNERNEIPIIAVTANVTITDMELCLRSGMKSYLAKPVRRRDLAIELQNLLKIRLVAD